MRRVYAKGTVRMRLASRDRALSDESAQAQQGFGPAIPSPSASVVLHPLGRDSVTITSGLLHQWQERNRSASLPMALRQLETAGNLANLRMAINRGGGEYRGPQFMDTDLYKTLEAIAWEVSRSPSEPLASFAAQATELLEAAQLPDGYLNSYVQVTGRPRYANLAYSHELYCAGHLIQAGVAAQRSQGPGGSALFAVARRFADHLVKEFLGTHDGLDGHPIVETALVELYRETGDEEYLRLAGQFVEQRGHGLIGDSGFGSRYLQDHLPVREANQLSGHAVRALYLEAGVVDLATETGDADLLTGIRGALGRHGLGQDLPDRQRRLPALRRELRRPVRAASRPRLQRDLRLDRQLPVELAAAAGHRRQQVRRPHGAGALQRLRGRHVHRR